MADNNATQGTNPPVQTPKKNFFGGEINLQDTNNFEALETNPEESEESSEFHPEPITYEEILQPTPQPPKEGDSFEDFDPFGDDQDTPQPTTKPEENKEIGISPQESPQNQEEILSNPIEHTPTNETENEEDQIEQFLPEETPTEEETSAEQELFEQEPEKTGNEIIDKFLELSNTAKKIFQLSEDRTHFKVLGGKNPKSTLEYLVYLVENEDEGTDLFIKKVETSTQNSTEEEHLLQRSYNQEKQHLEIFVDEIILYTIELSNNEGKNSKSQIIEKLNKFGFLFENYYEDIYKAYLEKKEGEEKKRQLHEIFRSF